MMPKNRYDWYTIIGALFCILVILIYCGWRIKISEEHMSRQDKAIDAYIPSVQKLLDNQKVIIDHIKREEAVWSKAGVKP